MAASSPGLVGCRGAPPSPVGALADSTLAGAGVAGRPPLVRCSRRALLPGESLLPDASLLAEASGMPDPVAVLPRAHVASRFERQSA